MNSLIFAAFLLFNSQLDLELNRAQETLPFRIIPYRNSILLYFISHTHGRRRMRVKGFIFKNESRIRDSSSSRGICPSFVQLLGVRKGVAARGSSVPVECARRMACINCPLFSSRSGMLYIGFCRRTRLVD